MRIVSLQGLESPPNNEQQFMRRGLTHTLARDGLACSELAEISSS